MEQSSIRGHWFWCSEDGDMVVIGTHDTALARTLAEADTGEPIVEEPRQHWVITGHDDHGEFWQPTEPDAPGAVPACGW